MSAKAGVAHISILFFPNWHVCMWAYLTVIACLAMEWIASKVDWFFNILVLQILLCYNGKGASCILKNVMTVSTVPKCQSKIWSKTSGSVLLVYQIRMQVMKEISSHGTGSPNETRLIRVIILHSQHCYTIHAPTFDVSLQDCSSDWILIRNTGC